MDNITLEEFKNKKIAYISLGCDKNRVDLEEMMSLVEKFGLKHTNLEEADIVVVNTCAFILPARKEAIDTIFEMISLKKVGKLEKIIVSGCLTARYLDELKNYLPEVDAFLTLKENVNIVETIASTYNLQIDIKKKDITQKTLQPKHYAYLKIADGCNNGCSYCTIPRIRGRYRSVPFEDIIKRAKELASGGAKEIIIVAQDVTRYGIDLYKKYRLVELLQELSKIKNIIWIRLHYLYPELVSDELLNEINNNPKICKYLDIPLQHIDDKILKSMNRRALEDESRALVDKIKTNYPNLVIRSTFIIGYPDENGFRFNKLLKFLKTAKLDQVGFFAYSREEGTKSFYMKKQVFEFIKKRRIKKAEQVQNEIANSINLAKVGNVYKIMIDDFDEKTGFYIARTNFQSPQIDYNVLVDCSENLQIGQFYDAKILDFKGYSFIATTKF